MELSLLQIQQFTVGAVCVFQDDSYHFRRFTERQVDVLFENDPRERNYDTTGIRIDFHTDASQVTVEVERSAKYEVLINDLIVYSERLEAPADFSLSLDGSDNRVTIILPNHCEGAIKRISLTGSTFARPHVYPVKLAFYGDSITQGWNSERQSQSFAWLVSRFFDADSRIYGVGGTTFIPEFPEDTGYRPDAVIVAMGTNDYGHGKKAMPEIKSDCATYLARVAQANPGSKLFCITPIWRQIGTQVKAAGTLSDVRKVIGQIAASLGYTVIDGLSLVPHTLDYYADKGTHPNDLGFMHYALALCKILRSHL